jgi:hypothetical protein
MFTEAERQIFEYHDGSAIVAADPMELARRVLQAFEGDPNATIRQMEVEANPLPVVCVATDRFIAGVRQAFNLEPFNPKTGEGALEQDCHRIWNEYQAWLEKKSPKRDPSLI